MKRINLVLGIHNHQPIGNFESVFERSFDRSYQPFVKLVQQYPSIKLSLHYSGILFDWFSARRPLFLKEIKKLVQRGQVKIMGGAYYEPILAIIPDADKSAQLEKLSKEIRNLFGNPPVGMWLTERVWEQHLAKPIADAGLRFIAVDDTHFKYAGLSEYELYSYYMTEEAGKSLAVFPISKKLRYTIPFQAVQKTIEYLREVATEEGERVVVYADDGEKFGVWPKTYDHVYRDGWLKDFFQALSDNREWINVIHFSEALERCKPAGRIYLPNASYAEMMHWVLRPKHFSQYEDAEIELKGQGKWELLEPFFKGGFWRNFLVKYPEINTMHKKMLRVSARARSVEQRLSKSGQEKLKNIFEHIWAAQCNDAYWHGVFGGLYMPLLRYPIFNHLLDAERELDKLEKRKTVNIETMDFDNDGYNELLVETPVLNCYFKPEQGGSVFELDFKPISLNLLDIVSRREEGYHKKLADAKVESSHEGTESIHDLVLAKEEGLERHLHYDWYRHGSLIDHFFGSAVTLDQVHASTYQELGDFVNQPYAFSTTKTAGKHRVTLSRQGSVWHGEIRHGVEVQKTIQFRPKNAGLEIEYRLKNLERVPISLWFGVEFCVGLQAGDAPDRYYYCDGVDIPDRRLRSMGELRGHTHLGLRDEWLGVDVRIEADKPATFWRFPLETISLSEEGFERIFQGSVVIPHWQVRLEKEWRVKLVHRFRRLK
ncbi:MAG TPA: alpha-amylase/4-alpha-glucanotransferase domain-containing protein [Bacteroidota bacterium]